MYFVINKKQGTLQVLSLVTMTSQVTHGDVIQSCGQTIAAEISPFSRVVDRHSGIYEFHI